MFEKFTEKARRVIFFSRYEASQYGSPYIETEYLLLGLLREDKALATRFFRSGSIDSIRKQIESRITTRERIPTNVEVPLSQESKRILNFAAEEAERLGHKHVGTEHLLLGLLREEKCLAAELLAERGLRLSTIREELGRAQSEMTTSDRPGVTSVLSKFAREVTQTSAEGQSHPLINRENELNRVVQVLCRHRNNNPVLIGEPASVNRLIVEELTQRIADGNVPFCLKGKKIVSIDFFQVEAESNGPIEFKLQLKSLIQELSQAQNVIIFIDELCGLLMAASPDGWLDAVSIVGPHLLSGTLQCVAATTAAGYSKVIGKHVSVARCFQEVRVSPPNEAECKRILVSTRETYEKFHGITFDDDAIATSVAVASKYVSGRSLLSTAESLLDEAGAHAEMRRAELVPDEVRETQKRITFINHRMEVALANHEFEKARFYSEEERKQKEELRALQATHVIDASTILRVTRQDIEEVAQLWTGTSAV